MLSLEDLMNTQVISSTGQFVRLREAPSTMYVVTGEQIRKWGIRRLSELVERLIPGATTAEDFDDQILAFRGITADNNLKVLLLLNGHEYNTQWNNGPTSEVELGLMDDIKKVEVMIGPHGALYGSGALIATINIITLDGNDFSGVRATGNLGSGGYKKADLLAGSQISDDLNCFFSMGGMEADGYKNNDNAPLNIARFPLSYRFYGEIHYKDFEFMTRFTRSSRAFYIQRASETRPNLWTNYDTFLVDGRKDFQFSTNLKSVLDFSFDSIQTQRHDFTLGTKLRAVGENRFSGKFTSFYSGWNRHDVLFGLYYRRDDFGADWSGDNFNFLTTIVDGTVIGVPADPYAVRTLTPYGRNVYAVFGQDSIKLSHYYSLLLGFRYDRVEAPQIPHPDSFTPRVAIVITPNEKTVLKAMFTSGLSRQPNAAVTSPDSFAFGNPTSTDLQHPERMYSFELAFSYQPKPDVDLAINTFYNSLQDIFGLDPKQKGQPPFTLSSGGRIDYLGFEAVASMKFCKKAAGRISYQHVQLGEVVHDVKELLTTTQANEHPFDYPEDVAKLLIETQLTRNLSINANAQLTWNDYGFMDRSQTLGTGYYSLVNANLVWDATPHIEVILSGYNLFNTQKRIPPFPLLSYLAERNGNLSVSFRY